MLYEDTKVAWLFPENIDRLVVNQSLHFNKGSQGNDVAGSDVRTAPVNFTGRLPQHAEHGAQAVWLVIPDLSAEFRQLSIVGPRESTLVSVLVVKAKFEKHADIKLFNKIRSMLATQQCCVVFVVDASVSDVFFKWCAEFTRCNPRAHVICTSPDVTWLATENQNR